MCLFKEEMGDEHIARHFEVLKPSEQVELEVSPNELRAELELTRLKQLQHEE
ncbi:MAG: hypothetical protein Ta2E_00850 [Mycoplasmoidaceae bacterium]|nr:MAG: hypothetical protein Ta2E_00850 [Mycoplasmoidaceae bacterium]